MRRRTAILAGASAVAAGFWAWRTWWPSDEEQIRRRLRAFADDFNEGASEGLGTVSRAATLGSYFTRDVMVDLGKGSPAIQGRETLIGMAARLTPRTAAFTLELLDITVTMTGSRRADVGLTAAFRRRTAAAGDETLDAREFAIEVIDDEGEWRVSRVKTVEAFRNPQSLH